jgi:membrane protein implicated in regulation of membrane protease activity
MLITRVFLWPIPYLYANKNRSYLLMDGEILTWMFLIGGVILILLEAVLPGGIAFLLGISGIGVGILRYFGFLEDPFTATFIWLLTSTVLTIAIRPFINKYFKDESSYKLADEDYEAMDQIAEVIEPINDMDNEGRIRFQGISWQARSMEGRIPQGVQVRIKYRDNTTWIVEPVDIIDSPKHQLKDSNKN